MRLSFAFLLFPAALCAQVINPAVQKVVDSVSEERIAAVEKKLESFGTRNTMSSQDDPKHGIGAARRWIESEFKSYSPRLQVRQDCHVEPKAGRIVRETTLCNVVAELKGTVHPDQYILVTAHYDSLVIVYKPGKKRGDDDPIDDVASADSPVAPGVTDDGSGIAAALELARVLSGYEFEKSLMFVAFAGEEQGLLGARHMAGVAKQTGMKIEALLNNDIIGSEVAGNGQRDNSSVRVFSAGPDDSGPRTVARYVKEIGERYVPSLRVNLVFRADRFSRGGDHTPFANAGFPAIRLTSTEENYENQHTLTDTFANTSPAYTVKVARINAAVAASLAWAPLAPEVTRLLAHGQNAGRPATLLGRGKSGYDAVAKWTVKDAEADLAGFVLTLRDSTAPEWQRQIAVGNVREYRIPDFSIDDVAIGVKAVDRDGNESLVAPYGAVVTPLPGDPAPKEPKPVETSQRAE